MKSLNALSRTQNSELSIQSDKAYTILCLTSFTTTAAAAAAAAAAATTTTTTNNNNIK